MLYKATKWQSGSGRWYVDNTSNLAAGSAVWYLPARLLNMELTDYVSMMIKEFKAKVWYNTSLSFIGFYWEENQERDAHKYLLWINKQARQNNWII